MAKLFAKEQADFTVSVSTYSLIRFIAVIIVVVLLGMFVQRTSHILALVGIAFFFSIALNSPIKWLASKLPRRKKDNRNLATAISMGIVVLLTFGFLITVVPPLSRQTITFAKAVPELVQSTKNGEGPIGKFVESYRLQDDVDNLSSQISSRVTNIGGSAISTVGKVGTSLLSLLTVLVLTIMMLIEGPKWTRVAADLIPNKHRDHTKALIIRMNKVIQGYVNGQVLLAAIAALLIAPMLFILDVGYPLALVVIIFICGLIPMVGHTIGATIVTIVALFTSVPAALIVLGYYILYQQIENYAVQPRIQANSTEMSPLLVFISVLLGGSIGGLLGAIVAIPLMGCLRILVVDYIDRQKQSDGVSTSA